MAMRRGGLGGRGLLSADLPARRTASGKRGRALEIFIEV